MMNTDVSRIRCSLRKIILEPLEHRQLFGFGQTDVTFGDAGHVTINFNTQSQTPAIQQMLVDSSNRILAGGTTGLTRLSSTGVVDTSFGTGGKITLAPTANFVGEAIDPTDDKIYVLVSTSTGTDLYRYTSTGQVDAPFAQSGMVEVTASTSFTPQAIAMQNDGKVLVAGLFQTDSGQGRKVRVYRLTTSGLIDTSFNFDGTSDLNLGLGTSPAPTLWDNVAGVNVLSDGDILIGGSSVDYAPNSDASLVTYDKGVLAVARLDSAGELDATYGSSGIARTDFAISGQIEISGIAGVEQNAFAVRSDGSALIAGYNSTAAVVAEFNPDGGIKFATTAAAGSDLNAPKSLSVLSDGRAVLLTQAKKIGDRGFALTALSNTDVMGNVVYTSDNDPTTDDIDESTSYGTTAVNSNGELLVGGGTGFNSTNEFEIAEYKVGKASDPRPDDFPFARANDIVKDSAGGLHVAYFDAADTHLMYAYRAPNGLWNAPVTIDSGANAGQYISIAVNSKNQPGIAYFDGNAGDMKVAEFNGKKWTIQTLDSKGSVGLYPSFSYDASDEPAVTYYNKSKGLLTFALKNIKTGRWGYENVDASGDNVGRSSVLEASPTTGRYTVAYVDNTTGSVMWAASQKGGTWQTYLAAKTRGGSDFLSMAFGSNYQPTIAFYDAYAGDLKITYFQKKGFFVKTLATKGTQGLYTQTFFGNTFNDPDVFSYNRSADKITLFSDTILSSPVATDVVTDGGKYLSVDWNGVTTDMAYFDATVNGIIVRPGPALSSIG